MNQHSADALGYDEAEAITAELRSMDVAAYVEDFAGGFGAITVIDGGGATPTVAYTFYRDSEGDLRFYTTDIPADADAAEACLLASNNEEAQDDEATHGFIEMRDGDTLHDYAQQIATYLDSWECTRRWDNLYEGIYAKNNAAIERAIKQAQAALAKAEGR